MPGSDRQPPATRVLVIALSGHNRIQKIAERVRILDRPNTNIVLERPQRDLNGMTGCAAIAAGQAVAVQRPQLGRTTLLREILRVPHRIDQTRTPAAVKRRERLVHVLPHHQTGTLALDHTTALAESVGDRATQVLRGLRGVEEAGSGVRDGHAR